MGVLYILDEPSIGLHQRDNDKLLDTLKQLRDLGNTLIVVEHDEDTMRAADYIVDIGPGAGVHGGRGGGRRHAGGGHGQPRTPSPASTSPARRKSPCRSTRRPGNGKCLDRSGARRRTT